MKINVRNLPLEQALAMPAPAPKKLKKPWWLFRTLVRILSVPDLVATKFKYEKIGMKKAGKGPFLILMNHSSFIDLKIASKVLYPMPYYIVSTADALVGKEWLMRKIGCMPTPKFTPDVALARNIARALHDQKTSVLLFPEAGYSFDGCTTTLPRKLGGLLKQLGVTVLSLITDGAFLRQPLYNNLRLRKVQTSAKLTCLVTKDEIAEKSVEELDAIIDSAFSFDNFRSQAVNGVQIGEPNRAEGLHRVLYKCPHCQAENQMLGENATLRCLACGKEYFMDELGRLSATDGETEFSHIPSWYNWQRECVKQELSNGMYRLETDVNLIMLCGYKCLYQIGEGKLTHDENGFTLTDPNGKLIHQQAPLFSYSVNADYNWYEIGDVVSIGDKKRQFYCIPKSNVSVTKVRFAAEELYKILKSKLK